MKNITKTLLVFIFLFGFNSNAKSQVDFMHSVGATVNTVFSPLGFGGTLPLVTYNPRLDYDLNENLSLSLTTYLSLGVSGSVNSATGSSLFFAFETPIMAQINWGYHSTKDSDQGFGIHAGAGYNIGMIGLGGLFHGPTANVGVKFLIADRFDLGIRANYTYAIGGIHMPGLGVLYNL